MKSIIKDNEVIIISFQHVGSVFDYLNYKNKWDGISGVFSCHIVSKSELTYLTLSGEIHGNCFVIIDSETIDMLLKDVNDKNKIFEILFFKIQPIVTTVNDKRQLYSTATSKRIV